MRMMIIKQHKQRIEKPTGGRGAVPALRADGEHLGAAAS